MSPRRDAWTAFLISLIAPGSGLLRARRWWCLVYFGAAAGLVMVKIAWLRWPAFVVLALVSAEHARRAVEIGRLRANRLGKPAAVRSRVLDRSGAGSGLDLRSELDVARPVEEVWARMVDLPGFVTIDPMHDRVIVQGPGGELKPGVELTIEHVAFGITFLRFGKLLTWRDGCGYSFSDLSPRGALGVFPHVFDFSLEPGEGESGTGSSRLTISIRGKWTSRLWPRWLGLPWVRYVSREHARMLRAALA
jgi:hypothetical protein